MHWNVTKYKITFVWFVWFHFTWFECLTFWVLFEVAWILCSWFALWFSLGLWWQCRCALLFRYGALRREHRSTNNNDAISRGYMQNAAYWPIELFTATWQSVMNSKPVRWMALLSEFRRKNMREKKMSENCSNILSETFADTSSKFQAHKFRIIKMKRKTFLKFIESDLRFDCGTQFVWRSEYCLNANSEVGSTWRFRQSCLVIISEQPWRRLRIDPTAIHEFHRSRPCLTINSIRSN